MTSRSKTYFYNGALFLLVLTSCQDKPSTTQGNVDELIAAELKKGMYDVNSYKAIETRIDTAYAPEEGVEMLNECANMIILEGKMAAAQQQLKKAEYDLDHSIKDCREGMEETDEYKRTNAKFDAASNAYTSALGNVENLKLKQTKHLKKIKDLAQAPRKALGLKAIHIYTAKANNGKEMQDTVVAYLSADGKSIRRTILMSAYRKMMNIEKQ